MFQLVTVSVRRLLAVGCVPLGLMLAAACGGEDPMDGSQHIADHEALLQCQGPSACPDGQVMEIEYGPGPISDMTCVMTALRDRTVGTYTVSRDRTWTNGTRRYDITMSVTPSGEVELAWYRVLSTYENSPNDGEVYSPTMRCQPKPATFFDDCMTQLSEAPYGDHLTGCIDPADDVTNLPWFESCVEQPPTCQ